MPMTDEPGFVDATTQAEMVRNGEVTPLEAGGLRNRARRAAQSCPQRRHHPDVRRGPRGGVTAHSRRPILRRPVPGQGLPGRVRGRPVHRVL